MVLQVVIGFGLGAELAAIIAEPTAKRLCAASCDDRTRWASRFATQVAKVSVPGSNPYDWQVLAID